MGWDCQFGAPAPLPLQNIQEGPPHRRGRLACPLQKASSKGSLGLGGRLIAALLDEQQGNAAVVDEQLQVGRTEQVGHACPFPCFKASINVLGSPRFGGGGPGCPQGGKCRPPPTPSGTGGDTPWSSGGVCPLPLP